MRSAAYLGVTLAAIVAGVGYGQTQSGGATTVAPLVVRPGPKADGDLPRFTIEQLSTVIEQAHAQGLKSLWGQCTRRYGTPQSEAAGEFNEAAIYTTDMRVQVALERAARALIEAEGARDEALEAGSDEQKARAEEASDRATVAFRNVRATANESHQRVLDFQAQWQAAPRCTAWACEIARYPDNNYFSNLAAAWRMPFQSPPAPEQIRALMDELTRQRLADDGAEGAFVPREYTDLRLSNVVAREVTERRTTSVLVSGKIVNTRSVPIPVPPLWVTAVDRSGELIKSEQLRHDRSVVRIEPGASLKFSYRLAPMPEKTARTTVTFAPAERPRAEKVDSEQGTCVPTLAERAAFEAGDVPPPDAPWITGSPNLEASLKATPPQRMGDRTGAAMAAHAMAGRP